jgi:hypothetical protein
VPVLARRSWQAWRSVPHARPGAPARTVKITTYERALYENVFKPAKALTTGNVTGLYQGQT